MYEATYVKRARGLVKHGRARFIDENTICLARPPITEGMDDRMESITDVINTTHPNVNDRPEAGMSEAALTLREILTRIDRIQADTSYLEAALSTLAQMVPADAGALPDIAGNAKAKAVAEAVSAREETNRQILQMLQQMYRDVCPTLQSRALTLAEKAMELGFCEQLGDVLDEIRHLGDRPAKEGPIAL